MLRWALVKSKEPFNFYRQWIFSHEDLYRNELLGFLHKNAELFKRIREKSKEGAGVLSADELQEIAIAAGIGSFIVHLTLRTLWQEGLLHLDAESILKSWPQG